MKRSPRRISLTLLAVLACLWLVTDALTAPPVLGPGPFPKLKPPDLVVKRVMLTKVSPGDFPTAQLTVVVKNVGKASASASTVALLYTDSIQKTTPFIVQTGNVPSIAPGQTSFIVVNFLNIAKPGVTMRGMFVAAVDVPVPGKPAGQVNELAGEFNNAFGFSVNAAPTKLPITWNNPAAK